MKKMHNLDQMSDDELLRLNREIVAALMARQHQEQRKELLAFTVGDRVSFQGPEGRPISGTIKRVNKKTLTIVTAHGLWKIDPGFVLKAKSVKAGRSKVLTLHRND